MDEVEARPFLRVSGRSWMPDGGASANEMSSPTTDHPSLHSVLLVGDKRARIYPRYRSSKAERGPRKYRGLPSAETVAKELDVFTGLSELAASKELSKDVSQAVGKMCEASDDGSGEMKPEQTKWKLVEDSLELKTLSVLMMH